jgi:hypothetical protein
MITKPGTAEAIIILYDFDFEHNHVFTDYPSSSRASRYLTKKQIIEIRAKARGGFTAAQIR